MSNAIGKSASAVLVVESDLFFSARIESVLTKLGYEVKILGDEERAVRWAAENSPALAIVNFGSSKFAPAEIVEKLKALPRTFPVMGFVSHKWLPEVRPNAMAAGCDLVVANSALNLRLPQLVARLIPDDGSAANIAEAAQLVEEDEAE